ncbi:TetR/AcrR family transcriptional regulator [Solibacillus sp. FSL H8-0538]|uniref:TetR/AcrR family transcriptional regulator n=1 Tax=Solibacillus sp. FSL H8-0538 TaxID=2921400 RepID=UPI0030F57A4B
MTKKTKERILEAAGKLMANRGFHAVSVKDIAEEANVSEMTVFRHFQTKLGILQSLIKVHSYIPYFEQFFSQALTANIVENLLQIANKYLDFMEKNKVIFLIAVQDRETIPELTEFISEDNTKQLQNLLSHYLQQKVEDGTLRLLDTQNAAIMFLTGLFGFFVSTTIAHNHFLHDQRQSFIHHHVELFLNGAKK